MSFRGQLIKAGITTNGSVMALGTAAVNGIKLSIGAGVKGINFAGLVSGQVIDYTTVTSVGETREDVEGAHLIKYGTSAAPIEYEPDSAGSHSAIQMYIRAEDVATGKSLAGIRTHVTFDGSGGSKATAYGGLFWVKLNCTGASGYTGDYLGGTPAGVQGVIEVPSGATLNSANEYQWITGVCGEVRPLDGTTITQTGVISAVRALINAHNSTISLGKLVGVHVHACAGAEGAVDVGVLIQTHDSSIITTGIQLETAQGTMTNGIVITGAVSDQIISYTTTDDVGDTTSAHLILYGTDSDEIIYTPSGTGSHSGIQMYITSDDCLTGLSLAAIRTRVTFTGTTKATAYAGQFWVRIDTEDGVGYFGDETGGHPSGLIGLIDIPVTATVTSPTAYATMAGVTGEVRPILGTVTKTGTISAVRALVQAANTNISGGGKLVGVHVHTLGSHTVDTGVLVQPHLYNTITTGIHLDSQYGTIATGISIGDHTANAILVTCSTATSALTDVSIASTFTAEAGWHIGLQSQVTWTPTTGNDPGGSAIRGKYHIDGTVDTLSWVTSIQGELRFLTGSVYNAAGSIYAAIQAFVCADANSTITTGHIAGVHIAAYSGESLDQGTGHSTYIWCDGDNSVGQMNSVMVIQTHATPYLIWITTTAADGIIDDIGDTGGATRAGRMKIRVDGNDRYLSYYTD